MLKFESDETRFQVKQSSYILPLILLPIPPALLYEHGASLLEGSIETGALVGLGFGILIPLFAAYQYLEFVNFEFHRDDGMFRWRRRELLHKSSGQVPLARIIAVRRESLENSGSAGLKYSYRLVVELDDGSIIPLSKGYSNVHDKALEQIVEQLRDYLNLAP